LLICSFARRRIFFQREKNSGIPVRLTQWDVAKEAFSMLGLTLRPFPFPRRRDVGRLVALAVLVCCAACSSGRKSAGLPQRDRNVITGEELIEGHFISVYDAVEALHPPWLTPRGPDSFIAPSEVLVYLDNIKLGGVSNLRNLNLHSIRYIRHYDGPNATARWGVGHAAGVILIATHN
jgi:hypothetical protein